MPYSAVQQYKQQAVQTMTGAELIIMLYDAAIKNLNFAKMMLEQKNHPAFMKCADKCRRIFQYLSGILDRSIPISAQLEQYYTFFNAEITRVEVSEDPTIIEPLIPLVEELRNTWVEAGRLAQMKK